MSSRVAPKSMRPRRTTSRSRRRSRHRRSRRNGVSRWYARAAASSSGWGRRQSASVSRASPSGSRASSLRHRTDSSRSARSARRRSGFRAGLASHANVRLRRKNGRVPARIYAVANQKGGVGKTTTAINLAACLAEAGSPCLVVDLDPQANATSGLGERATGTSSYDLLDGAPLSELAKPTKFANLDLVPAKRDLAGAVVELARRDDAERYLAEALSSGTERYDFVFLDCPPSLGPLTVNALAASDRVLVPVQAEYYALEGLSQLVESVELI